jgi:hypothetical protein
MVFDVRPNVVFVSMRSVYPKQEMRQSIFFLRYLAIPGSRMLEFTGRSV